MMGLLLSRKRKTGRRKRREVGIKANKKHNDLMRALGGMKLLSRVRLWRLVMRGDGCGGLLFERHRKRREGEERGRRRKRVSIVGKGTFDFEFALVLRIRLGIVD